MARVLDLTPPVFTITITLRSVRVGRMDKDTLRVAAAGDDKLVDKLRKVAQLEHIQEAGFRTERLRNNVRFATPCDLLASSTLGDKVRWHTESTIELYSTREKTVSTFETRQVTVASKHRQRSS